MAKKDEFNWCSIHYTLEKNLNSGFMINSR